MHCSPECGLGRSDRLLQHSKKLQTRSTPGLAGAQPSPSRRCSRSTRRGRSRHGWRACISRWCAELSSLHLSAAEDAGMGSATNPARSWAAGDAEAVGGMITMTEALGHPPQPRRPLWQPARRLAGSEPAHHCVLLSLGNWPCTIRPARGQRPAPQLLKQVLDRNGRRCFAVCVASEVLVIMPGDAGGDPCADQYAGGLAYSSTMRCQPRWTQDG